MLKVIDEINSRVYYIPAGEEVPVDICAKGYLLDNGVFVQHLRGKWIDSNNNEYEPICTTDNRIEGFIKKVLGIKQSVAE